MPDINRPLSESEAFPAVADSWAVSRNLISEGGVSLSLRASNNLSDIVSRTIARYNLGVTIGTDVQAYSTKLTKYAGGPIPSDFTIALMDSVDGEDWRAAIGAGTVTSVSLSGGTTGLTVENSTITGAGTFVLDGTLMLENGGTGVTSLLDLQELLGIAEISTASGIGTESFGEGVIPDGSTVQESLAFLNANVFDLLTRVQALEAAHP